MVMRQLPEPDLHWTDHYVKYGFAVIRGLVNRQYIDRALAEVVRIVDYDKPVHEWTTGEPSPERQKRITEASNNAVLAEIYDQPELRACIDEMFGSPDDFNNERQFKLFVNVYNESAKAAVATDGHIDFVKTPVPLLGSGFMFQVCLSPSDEFGGNITIYPGTHIPIQKAVIDNPDWRYPDDADCIPVVEPFEFVAEPGDVLLFHHLVYHSGNACHGANRRPRIALHCQALRHDWLEEVDPQDPTLSPWARSMAQNGPIYVGPNEKVVRMANRGEYRPPAK